MDEDTLALLLTQTPIAFYRLDANDQLVDANPAWLELHGYTSFDQVRGRNIQFAYVDPQQAETLRKTIIFNGILKDQIIELQRHSGERFWGSIYSRKVTDDSGNYAGREGFVVDATARYIHERIIKHIPIGYYSVDTKNGKDIISYCNPEFAEMFGFASPEAARDTDISELYLNYEDYEKFQTRAHQEGIIHHELDVQTIDKKRHFWIEAITRIQKTAQGEITGRVGVVRDLTDDLPLNRLRKNLGVVLHSFTNVFLVMKSDLDATVRALGPFQLPRPERESHTQLLAQMREPIATLRHSIAITIQNFAKRLDNSDLYYSLVNLQEDLAYAEETDPVFRVHNVRDVAMKIANTCQISLDHHKSARQPLKQVRDDAYQVLHTVARYRLNERITDVLDMEYTLRGIRTYFTTPALAISRTLAPINFWTLVKESMQNLRDFAASRSVKFRSSRVAKGTTIMADKKEMARAISNLLHNAIKYSWFRETETWVDIMLTEENDTLVLEIENYGVPIAKDEIESGVIYRFGYRSRLSSDRGRVGTGIGLPDALEIVRQCGGDLTIHSRPAFSGGIAENLDPFLTTAIVTIPLLR